METNFTLPNREQGERLVPIYWDHDQKTVNSALGISARRERELERAFEDIFNPVKGEVSMYDKFSEKIEAALKLAVNEQERIYIAFQLGQNTGKSKFMDMISGAIIGRMGGSKNND